MGCQQSQSELSPQLVEELIQIFRKIDIDNSKTIDKQETLKFWKSNFAKINTDALFKAVDVDKNGNISEEEWLKFWKTVKKGGHSEQEIRDELQNLKEGQSWVYFDNK